MELEKENIEGEEKQTVAGFVDIMNLHFKRTSNNVTELNKWKQNLPTFPNKSCWL